MARQADLLPVEEARARILAPFERLQPERVSLDRALGRVLAEPLRSSFNLPPFANSSMDGFALAAAATGGADPDEGTRLRVAFHVPAGSTATQPLPAGECARIMTGAPLPVGADAVIPFEEVDDEGEWIVVRRPVAAGSCVRPAGQDVGTNEALLEPGEVLGPAQIALLAATGNSEVAVTRRPVVAILATGDELVAPGSPLGPGQIYNSNTPMLAAAVAEAGGIARTLPTVEDTREALHEALTAVTGAHLLLTSGGASVGDFDHVKDVVGEAGDLTFWRVRVRPGKPLLFGRVGEVPVIGLPGNPTSAMVTFEQFVRPVIRCMLGAPLMRPQVRVVLDEPIDNRGGRRTYARVSLSFRDGALHARLSGGQDSAMILPLARADALLEVPEDRDELLPGETAIAQVWRLPGSD